MKKLIISALLFAAASTATAQECKKYLEEEIEDAFTTTDVIHSTPVVYSQPTMVDSRTISFRVMDKNRFFVHLSSGNSRDLIFGSDVTITFSNGEDLALRIEQLERIKEGTESITHGNCRVYSKEEVKLFYTYQVKQINLGGSKQVFDITEKDREKIKHGAICTIERATLDNMDFTSKRKTRLIPDPAGVSFDAGSSSMVIMSGNIKCEFEKDTIIDGLPNRAAKTKEIVTSPHPLKIQVRQNGNKYTLALTYSKDLGCADKTSYILFKFKDGSTKEFEHTGEEDCSENATFIADISANRDLFWTNDVTMVRLSYSEYYADLGIANPAYLGQVLKYCFQ